MTSKKDTSKQADSVDPNGIVPDADGALLHMETPGSGWGSPQALMPEDSMPNMPPADPQHQQPGKAPESGSRKSKHSSEEPSEGDEATIDEALSHAGQESEIEQERKDKEAA